MNPAQLRNRLIQHRCMDCGFLGAIERPDSGRALADFGEVAEEHRQQWRQRLRMARKTGKLGESEYDPSMGFDLGIDSGLRFGVMGGLGRPEGPRTTFHIPGPRETQVGSSRKCWLVPGCRAEVDHGPKWQRSFRLARPSAQ